MADCPSVHRAIGDVAERLVRIELATVVAPLADLLAWCIARGALTLQQATSENLLLICCRSPDGSREATSADPDSSSKTMDLDQTNRPDTTGAREICC